MEAIGSIEARWRTDPMYTFGEAARFAKVSPTTVRNWLFGNISPKGTVRPPLLSSYGSQGPMVSFLQLIEIAVAARLRNAEHATFKRVLKAHLKGQELLGTAYPFAHADLMAIGGHIVNIIRGKDEDPIYQALDEPSQWTLPGIVAIRDVTKTELEYEKELAARWWPDGMHGPIVIDPRFSTGLPTIAGRGVTAAAICSRFHKSLESMDFIMQDFKLEREQVEAALRYGERLAA